MSQEVEENEWKQRTVPDTASQKHGYSSELSKAEAVYRILLDGRHHAISGG